MNFDDTPEEAAFRGKVRAWLADNAPWHLLPEIRRAATPGTLTIDSGDPVQASKAWQRRKAEAGYACPAWPREYGGGGLSPIERVIWQQEEGAFHQLSLLFSIGFGMCGPTLMAWASEERKAERLPPMIRGDEIWCQLFSEPAAGSDLAGLRTRAAPAEDGSGDWIVDGQKIWTSNAHHADWGLLLARTDPTVPKHKGLTMFILDMRSPGVEIRPIYQANRQSSFNEVFFTGVRIPDGQRLGAVGQGWQVSLTTLMNERMTIGSNIRTGFEEILALARRLPDGEGGRAIGDKAVRARLARWAVMASGLKYTSMRAVSAVSRGEVPGPENSIGKLVSARMRQEIATYGIELQGQAGVADAPEEAQLGAWFQANLMRSPAMRIEGGSDEILRNVIAERVLGLPGEIRVDKNVAFNDIPARGAR